MQKTQAGNALQRYGDELIAMGPFASLKLGLDPSQTVLRLDTYNLACAPFRFGLKQAALLCFLSRDELAFFQRYKGSLGGLALSMQPADSQKPLKIFARCTVSSIGPMKGRDKVGLVALDWKPCPPDLTAAFLDYFALLDRLKAEYEEFRSPMVPMNAETAKGMGYNSYATLASGGEPFKAALFQLSSARLDFLLPMQSPDLEVAAAVQVKLFFRKYQFAVAGRVASVDRLPSGVRRVGVDARFAPELVELLADWRFTSRLAARQEQNSPG
ncbi:MAG: hypothetical protein JXA15_07520 [Spirochaetales bacterium]|nr:hypothetical protein [Spirochaetales bacterium]